MGAAVMITDVNITPNPVQTGKQYIISVEIKETIRVLGDDGAVLTTEAGAYLLAPDQEIRAFGDADGAALNDMDGALIETEEEL